MSLKHVLLLSACVCALAMPAAAQGAAEPAAEPAATPAADPAAGTGSEEVVVTAQKRRQNLQDVSAAVSAYTAETRQLVGIDTLQDYTNFTPGLSYSGAEDRVFVRGVGRQTNTNGSDPGVATYTDGVYDARTATVGISDFFLERVEVLRGPQGTLYGRNSIGGAINAISKRPSDEFEGEVRLGIGDYGVANAELSLSAPLADWLRARVAGAYYDQEDGYFTNVAGGPSEGGVGERRYAELQFEADLGPDVGLWLKAFSSSSGLLARSRNQIDAYDYAPYPTGYIAPGSAFGFLTGLYAPLDAATANPGVTDIRAFSTNTPQTARLHDNAGVTGELTWELPGVLVKYIGGYQAYVFDSTNELDNTAVTSYVFPLSPGAICGFIPGCAPLQVFPSQQFNYVEDKSFSSHELNVSSTGDGPLQWIAGVYYYTEDATQESHFNAPDQPQLKAPINGPANPLGDFVYAASALETQSYAAFAQIDWAVADDVKITGGLRYTHDSKEGAESFRIICFGCALSPDQYGSLTPAYDITALSISLAPAPGVSTPVAIDPLTGNAVRGLSGSWNATTGTIGVEWKPDADTLVFAKFSRGYKSGGFNAGGISALPQTDPEGVNAYELGYKTNFGRTFQLNAAFFFYDYEGLQVPLTVTTPGGANLTEFFNLESSQSYGIELEAVWRPVDELQVLFNYGYAQSEIQDACCFIDGADPLAVQPGAQPVGPLVGGQQPQSLVGEELPQTPRNKVAINAIYTLDFDPGTLDLSASYIWKDESYSLVFNRPYTRMPAYDQVDLRAVWTSTDSDYRIIAFVKNVFDEVGYDGASGTAYAAGFAPPNTVARTYSLTPPRTIGLQVQYRFN